MLFSEAQTFITDFQIDTTFNPLSTPGQGEIVQAGGQYTLHWTPSNTQGVTFDLCQGTLKDFTRYSESLYVGINLQNTGTYIWNVDANIVPGSNFLLVIQQGDNIGSSSPIFAIANNKAVTSIVTTSRNTPTTLSSSLISQTTTLSTSRFTSSTTRSTSGNPPTTSSVTSSDTHSGSSSSTSSISTSSTSACPATPSATGYSALTCLIPTPKPNWQGLRTPNYDTMYREYTVDLYCDGGSSGLDYGVYGFYSWIENLASIMSNIYTAIQQDQNPIGRRAAFRILNGVIPFVICCIRAGFLIRSLGRCRKKVNRILPHEPRTTVQIFYWVAIWGWALSALSGFLIAIDWHRRAAIVPCIALFYVLFSQVMLYYSYTSFVYIDAVIVKAIMAVSIPLVLWLIYATVLSFIMHKRGSICTIVSNVSILWLITFYAWTIGMSKILLGRTTNDIWGSYAVKTTVQLVQLVLTTILGPLGIITSGLAVAGQ